MEHIEHYELPVEAQDISVGGFWGDVLQGTCQSWMLRVSDELLLSGFRSHPGIQPWIGEHVGKYLLGAIPISRMLDSEALDAKVQYLVEALVKTQEDDGYLGTYAQKGRWLGPHTVTRDVWDVWVHKYCILALLAYYGATRWDPALEAAVRAADLIMQEFGPRGEHDLNVASHHEGLGSGSVLEPIMLLYQATGERRYLEFAEHVLSRWEDPDGPRLMPVLRERGDVSTIGDGKAYEMMSCFVGLVEYARVAGDRGVLQMVLDARNRIADTQRYPTGGMSNREYFWRPGLFPEWASMETCAAFTWMQLNLRLYELTGDVRALDLVEEAAWNQLLPAVSPRYDTWSYHLSMMGPKRFFRQWVQGVGKKDADFSGAPVTCCHTNGQRGLALVPRYAYGVTPEGALAVNFYGESGARLQLPGVGQTQIAQQTGFPCSGEITIRVTPESNREYELLLRRPPWASQVLVDGEEAGGDERRISLQRSGPATIRLHLVMRPHVRMCGFEARGKCAVAYGPLVMALDSSPRGLGLDQVALKLGRGGIADNLRASTTPDGWPAIEVPVCRIPELAVAEAWAEPAGRVLLKPVLFTGLEGNPGLDSVIDGEDVKHYNLAKVQQSLFPEYRVLLPYLWCPG